MTSAAYRAMPYSGGQAQAKAPSAMRGAMCVSTPARGCNPLPGGALLALVAVLAAALLASRTAVEAAEKQRLAGRRSRAQIPRVPVRSCPACTLTPWAAPGCLYAPILASFQ
jgi:hypothetical protein